jgi:hypothetical protein
MPRDEDRAVVEQAAEPAAASPDDEAGGLPAEPATASLDGEADEASELREAGVAEA